MSFVPTALTDANFNTAIALWFSDEAAAIETYGHISDWNVSAVTNMRQAFRNKAEFNEDISNWDTSSVTNMQTDVQRLLSCFCFVLISPSVIGTPLAVTNFSTFSGGCTRSSTNHRQLGHLQGRNMMHQCSIENAAKFNQPIGNWDTSLSCS